MAAEDDANVQVFCRVRPPNEREGFAKSSCVAVAGDARSVLLQSRHAPTPRAFTFDRAFGAHATQRDVFAAAGAPITRACLQGYNGTIFAYGQTGSGKTFTMQGPDRVLDAAARLSPQDAELRGLVPRVFDFLFDGSSGSANDREDETASRVQHTFACSFLEIYNERVFDLLDGASRDAAGAGLQLRENGRKGVFVEGLTESVVTDAAQAAQLMAVGAQNRRVGQTAMNRESSRSHSVFVLQIQSTETTPDGVTRVRSSRFNLVDLAGSERQRSTEAAGERLKEAGSINKSLSALGNVIMGLVEQSAGKNRHVHYRDSKLTFLLKDSLGGNSKTFMIATVSPAEDSAVETLSTLKFAQRAKLIRNNAVINEDSTGSVLVLQEEIQRLRRQLHQALHESTHTLQEPQSQQVMLPPPPPSSTSISTSSETSVSSSFAHCDPAVDGRFRDLEAAFATSVEKNSQLKRSNERLRMQEEHLKALCAEMKRNITHLRMVLRLRQSSSNNNSSSSNSSSSNSAEELEKMADYEPSVDAIEWRLKYEELEESYAELQDEVQQRRMAEQFAGFEHGSRVEGEVEALNLMLLALTKQLASVVRDKHELRDRLVRLTESAEGDADMSSSSTSLALLETDKTIAQLREEMATQAHELHAKINTALVARDAAEEKAREASLELLAMKQKEAAWSIQATERDIRLEDSARLLRQAEDARVLAGNLLTEERQQHEEALVRANQDHEAARLELETKLSDAFTRKLQLEHDCSALKQEAVSLRADRDELAQKASALEEQLAVLRSAVSEKEQELARQSQQHALEAEKQRAQVTQMNDAMNALEAEHSKTLQQKAEEIAHLHARYERAALESAQKAQQVQQAHEERVRAMERASAAQKEADDCKYAALENEMANLMKRSAQLEGELAGLTRTLKEAKTAAEHFEQKLGEEQTKREAQQSELESSKQTLEALQSAHDALTRERERLRTDVDARAETITALEQSRAELTQRCHTLHTDIETRDAAAQKLSVELAALTEQLGAAKIREEKLTSELACAREQAIVAGEEHHKAIASLQTAHDAESAGLQSRLETALQEFAQKEEHMARSHAEQLVEIERASAGLKEDYENKRAALESELAAAQKQSAQREHEVVHLSSKLEKAESTAGRLEQELGEQQETRERLQSQLAKHEQELATLQAAHDAVRSDAGAQVALVEALARSKKELEKRCEKLQRDAETSSSSAKKLSNEMAALTERLDAAKVRGDELASELASARAQMEAASAEHSEALASAQKAHAVELEEAKQAAASEVATLRESLAANTHALQSSMAAKLKQTAESLRHTENELAAAKVTNSELASVVANLRSKVEGLELANSKLQQDHETQEKLTAITERLEQRAAELDKKSERVEAEAKETEKEKEALAATRRKLESIRVDYEKSQLRLAELEPLVVQLRSEKQQLERETRAQTARLENISKENDRLVGHDNKRQKIQYHFKVKEENNRLLGEVRQLTDDKFRLQTKLDKLRLALKEKENLGEAVVTVAPKRPLGATSASSASANVKTNATSSSSSSSSSSGMAARPPAVKKLIPVSSGLGGLESSSLVTSSRPKKRLHSRIERP